MSDTPPHTYRHLFYSLSPPTLLLPFLFVLPLFFFFSFTAAPTETQTRYQTSVFAVHIALIQTIAITHHTPHLIFSSL